MEVKYCVWKTLDWSGTANKAAQKIRKAIPKMGSPCWKKDKSGVRKFCGSVFIFRSAIAFCEGDSDARTVKGKIR